jgi:predicted  nucleic acid-binding Zn-ribbon protein
MAGEPSVEEKLKALYELQMIDSKIDKIEVLKGELPIEVSDLEDEIVGLDTRVKRLTNNISDFDSEIAKHRSNIKEAEALIERYTRQLDNVKNNREYDALTKELELQRLEIQLSEKKIGQTDKDKLAKQETLTAAEKRLADKQKALETKKKELQEIIKKTEKEEEKLRKQSEKAKKSIEDRLMFSYNKIRNSYRNGLAVVTVERSACGGCFNMIPPQLQLEISMSKKIIACEHCGRILVDDVIAGQVEPEEATK